MCSVSSVTVLFMRPSSLVSVARLCIKRVFGKLYELDELKKNEALAFEFYQTTRSGSEFLVHVVEMVIILTRSNFDQD